MDKSRGNGKRRWKVNGQWGSGWVRDDREIAGMVTQGVPSLDLAAPGVFQYVGVVMADAVPVRPHPGSHGPHPHQLPGARCHNSGHVRPLLKLPGDRALPGCQRNKWQDKEKNATYHKGGGLCCQSKMGFPCASRSELSPGDHVHKLSSGGLETSQRVLNWCRHCY
jgi:hypothetical protein